LRNRVWKLNLGVDAKIIKETRFLVWYRERGDRAVVEKPGLEAKSRCRANKVITETRFLGRSREGGDRVAVEKPGLVVKSRRGCQSYQRNPVSGLVPGRGAIAWQLRNWVW